jgi:hypothetical protein
MKAFSGIAVRTNALKITIWWNNVKKTTPKPLLKTGGV